jgi:hypothetical protein
MVSGFCPSKIMALCLALILYTKEITDARKKVICRMARYVEGRKWGNVVGEWHV